MYCPKVPYLGNSPEILIECSAWSWHTPSLCPFMHLAFKGMISPISFSLEVDHRKLVVLLTPASGPRHPDGYSGAWRIACSRHQQASLTHTQAAMLLLGVDFFPLSFFYYFLGTSNIVLKIIWDWDRMMCDGRKLEPNIFTVLAHIPHISKADRLIWNSLFFQVIAYSFNPFPPPKTRMSEEPLKVALIAVFISDYLHHDFQQDTQEVKQYIIYNR